MGKTRLAELIATLSLATDLGMGQPMEFALGVAVLGVALADRAGLGPAEAADIFYLALVKHIGCTSDAFEFANFTGGDDVAFRRRAMLWPATPKPDVLRAIIRHTGEDRPPLGRSRLVARMVAGGERRPRDSVAAHCEAGGRLAERLGLGEGVLAGLRQEQERWDGTGLPDGLSGESLSTAHRFVMVAHDALATREAGGDLLDIVRARSGKAYDPQVVQVFADAWDAFEAEERSDLWARALAAEPNPPVVVGDDDIDRIALAIADFTDLKSPFLLGHSTRVAALVDTAAQAIGMSDDQRGTARRAALLHDVGRTGIPNGIWDKASALTAHEAERVRLHSYYTERVLARSSVLAHLAVTAGSHHENLDGTGYHRGVAGGYLEGTARLLRAADCLDAMTSDRPHRAAWSLEEAAAALKAEVEAGRLDADAVSSVLNAAGGPPLRLRSPRPGGLSEREVEVLRLMVRGLTNKQIGGRLYVSPKTVGHHVQHIYTKIGVTSRAGAALFAMESGLI